MIVESDTLFIIKTLIIFPLIIYYSGSSKLCLLLFEFLNEILQLRTQYGGFLLLRAR